jgi:hypothetical protein
MKDQKTKTTPEVVAKDVDSVKKEAESNGIRFATEDSVQSASSWVIYKYAKTFSKLAQ